MLAWNHVTKLNMQSSSWILHFWLNATLNCRTDLDNYQKEVVPFQLFPLYNLMANHGKVWNTTL